MLTLNAENIFRLNYFQRLIQCTNDKILIILIIINFWMLRGRFGIYSIRNNDFQVGLCTGFRRSKFCLVFLQLVLFFEILFRLKKRV